MKRNQFAPLANRDIDQGEFASTWIKLIDYESALNRGRIVYPLLAIVMAVAVSGGLTYAIPSTQLADLLGIIVFTTFMVMVASVIWIIFLLGDPPLKSYNFERGVDILKHMHKTYNLYEHREISVLYKNAHLTVN